MDIVIILLVLGFTLLYIATINNKCPPPTVIYKSISENLLDVQFNSSPSEIYKSMFTQSSPWIGGYQLGNGKTNKNSTTNKQTE
jgi:hypothetical protein